MFLKVDNVGAERMCSGRLFQATGPATQNAVISLSGVRGGEGRVARYRNHIVLLTNRAKSSGRLARRVQNVDRTRHRTQNFDFLATPPTTLVAAHHLKPNQLLSSITSQVSA